MIERIRVDASGAETTALGTWDPSVNAVSYDMATYTSATTDGDDDDPAQDVAERVDRVAASQDHRD